MTVYRISCDHEGCEWSSLIDLSDVVGEWRPPRDTGLLDSRGEPIIDVWEGELIEHAYTIHYVDVHQADSVPPMCSWAIKE